MKKRVSLTFTHFAKTLTPNYHRSFYCSNLFAIFPVQNFHWGKLLELGTSDVLVSNCIFKKFLDPNGQFAL